MKKGIIKGMGKIKTKENGITLIALVVTIIVLLILAGVAITFLFGQNGLIARAQDATKNHKIAELQEKLEVEKGPVQLDTEGNTTIEKYLDHIVKEGIIDEDDIRDTEDEKSKNIIVEDEYVFLVEEEEDGNIKITYQGEVKKLKPTLEIEVTKITTNSITVKAIATTTKNAKYEYYLKDVLLGEEYQLKDTSKIDEYVYEGLVQDKEYQIKVKIKSSFGDDEKESGVIRTIPLENLVEGNITFSYNPTGWSKDKVIVTAKSNITIPEGYRLETSTDLNTWTTELSQTFTAVGTMYARFYDGVNETNSVLATVTKIDRGIPKATIELSSTTTDTMSSITATVTITDEGNSGINFTNCKWIYTTKKDKIGTNPASYTGGKITSDAQILTLQASKAGTYYLHVLCADNATNIEEYVSPAVTVSLKTNFTADGLIEGVAKIGAEGNYKITVSGVTYNLHVYYFDGNQTWSTNQVFGDTNDVGGSETTDYAKNMVVVKVNGNLTINSGVTVEPYSTEYGGPKGFFIYSTGTLTNNGTITTTAKGAKAVGENVYLYKNLDNTYETVPATGGAGGALAQCGSTHSLAVKVGNAGKNGTNRQTGGGGSGGAVATEYTGSESFNARSGPGAKGTSYSGGSGGGGTYGSASQKAEAGAENGGKGGNGVGTAKYTWGVGGGAGNPGGTHSSSGQDGKNGTGGLLIIYANNFCNKGQITSDGSKGGNAYRGAGGGSGGGSINIFYNTNSSTSTTITANGGAGGTGTRSGGETANGGAGGTGSIIKGSIKTGTFVAQ